MEAYGAAAAASLAQYEATPLIVDDQVEIVEGDWHGNQTVVMEFESVEKARQWYASSLYQEAVSLRQAAADCNVVIASGFVPRRP
jgi:uncharacterized protein (DUF1330 family)